MLQEELDKKREIQKGYKYNVEIRRKNRVKAKQKIEIFIKKLQDENDELKNSTTWQKSQEEELQDSRQKVEIWETIEQKWTKALFLHKKQHKALDSHVKTLTKKKKEKENVLTNLELINLNNVFMLQFEEIKRKITYVYKDI